MGDEVALAAVPSTVVWAAAHAAQLDPQDQHQTGAPAAATPPAASAAMPAAVVRSSGTRGRITRRVRSGQTRTPAGTGYSAVNATWYWMRLFSLVPSPGTGSTATVTVLTASVLGASGIGMLTVSVSPAAMRGIVWSTLIRLPFVIETETPRSVSSDSPWFWTCDVEGQLVARRARGSRRSRSASTPAGSTVTPWMPVPCRPGVAGLLAAAGDPAEPRLHRVGIEPAEVRQEAVGREALVDAALVVRGRAARAPCAAGRSRRLRAAPASARRSR